MSRLVAYTSEQIPYAWDRVKPHIKRALDRGSNYTLGEVLEGLTRKEMQLWTSFNGRETEAALVTAIHTDRDGTFCLLLAAGGTNMNEWKEWLSILEDWAKDQGATEMRIYGRIGWARAIGFNIDYAVMSKEI